VFVALFLILAAAVLQPQNAFAQGKSILVIAPHPDDEALCCSGVIYSALQAGNTVTVAIVTNGDDYTSPASKSAGLTREGESIAAMAGLGLASKNVIFLGYGDQSLQQLLFATSSITVYTSVAGQTKTYANQGLGGVSYHQYLTGSAGSYSQATILSDFQSLLKNLAPTDIYTTGFWDDHPDHRATYAFTAQALIALKKQGLLTATRIHETWIHAPCEDCESYVWPEPVFTPTQPFPEPDFISQTPYDWTQIENIPVPAPMQDPNQNTNLKWNTIASYQTQTEGDSSSYLFGFVKAGEFFWVRNFQTNVAVLATATASSQMTSGLQAASNAIDGIIAGVPNPLDDGLNYTSFAPSGGGEWVTNGQLAGAWIKLTWPSSVTTSEVILYGRPDGTDNVLSGTLTFSDGSSVPVGALPVGGAGYPITFPSKTITWMQFTVNTAQGQNIGLAEIEVFGTLTSSVGSFGPQMTDGPVANPATVGVGQIAPMTTSAFDVYGYPLTYTWSANAGSVTGSGTSVNYNPPAASGTYAATVIVTDGHGNSTQNSTFIIAACGICGTVSGTSGSAVTVNLTGAQTATTATNSASGIFSFPGVANGKYTVTPTSSGYTFNPTSLSVTVSGGNDVTGANFTATALGGNTPATPMISPATATYTTPQTVTITDGTMGAKIYYTTDGTPPSTSSNLYGTSFQVSATTTVKAIAVANLTSSAIATSVITINNASGGGPAFVQSAGNYGESVAYTVKIAPSAGDFLAVAVWQIEGLSTPSSVTDNKGSVYAKDCDLTYNQGYGTNRRVTVYHLLNAPSGITGVTVTPNKPSRAIVAEYSGMPTTGAVLDVCGAVNNQTTASWSSLATTTTATDLILGLADTGVTQNAGYAPGAGWNNRLAQPDSKDLDDSYLEDRTGAIAGSYTATGTATVSGFESSVVVAFKAASTPTAPTITSAASATFTVGSAGTFTLSATGMPAPTFSESGALPSGVTFNAATGVLSGTPAAGTAATYPISFTAQNGVSPNATQSFTLKVGTAVVGNAAYVRSAGNAAESVAYTVKISPTAGDFLAVIVWQVEGSTTPASVTDNKGSVYVKDCDLTYDQGFGPNRRVTVYHLLNAPSGITGVTVTPNKPSRSIVVEYSGMTATAGLDVCGTVNNQTNVTSWTSTALSTTGTDVVLGLADTGTTGSAGYSVGSGWNNRLSQGDNIDNDTGYIEDKLNATPGNYTATGTTSGAMLQSSVVIAFKVQ
jgi:LmbE family N-acetylglucosaminyl deacetylase